MNSDFENHKKAQDSAKNVLGKLPQFIEPHITEKDIVQIATNLLVEEGIHTTWYYGVHALVLLGSRSCVSISGKQYVPSDEVVGDFNLVTVDLSPEINGCWGDCARSIVIENGVATDDPSSTEMAEGISTELWLHNEMKGYVKPTTTFHDLYHFCNALIYERGYENLDFHKNLGHSIVHDKKDRLFIESDCTISLSEVPFFTFEPHIRRCGSSWGFKHENIYYFDPDTVLKEL
jgi:Xaa-Pro aminopeptidase